MASVVSRARVTRLRNRLAAVAAEPGRALRVTTAAATAVILALGLAAIPAAAGAAVATPPAATTATTATSATTIGTGPRGASQHAAPAGQLTMLAAATARLRTQAAGGHWMPGTDVALAVLAQRARAAVRTTAARSGGITGLVVGAGGLPVAGACVTAVGPDGSQTATAAPDGTFQLSGLQAGSYALEYRDCATARQYRDVWSGGAGWQSAASRFLVSAGQVRRVPAMMLVPATSTTAAAGRALFGRLLAHSAEAGLTAATAARTGKIAGLVTGKGHPLRGICVAAFPVDGGVGYGATTAKNGTYTVRHVKPGRYVVLFALEGCGRNWLQQAYPDASGPFAGFGGGGARAITVTSGKTTRGINAKLLLGGEISGTVTAKSGRKLGGICVQAIGRVRGGEVGFEVGTSGNGRYDLPALFPGTYRLAFTTGCPSKANYAPASHRPVKIGSGQDVGNVSVSLGTGAVVTGTVTLGSSSGTPLPGMCVFASNSDGSVNSAGSTGTDGSYRVRGLGTGRYEVDISPGCNNEGNYTGTQLTARTTAGKVTSGVNAILQVGAQISGTVTDSNGDQVAGMCIALAGTGDSEFADIPGSTGEGATPGGYQITGLPAGTYELGFEAGCGNSGSYAPYWYDGQTSEGLATPIVLAGGGSATINAQLQPGATITGKVTNAAGHGLSGLCVYAATAQQAELGEVFQADAGTHDGTYSIRDLAPGQYLVDFGCGQDARYADQWFDGAPDSGSAALVSASAGRTTGISAVLRPGGTISGVVTGKSGRPLAGVCATAVSAGQAATQGAGFVLGTPETNARGQYRITGLAAGRYDVAFSPCTESSPYAMRWYRGTASPLSATAVKVSSGKTTAGINVRLVTGGTVSGEVLTATHAPLRNVCVFAFDARTGSVGFGFTGKAGTYKLTGLSSGGYTVEFEPCDNRNLVSVLSRAKVTAPHATTGIDATLAPGGSVAGVVTTAGVPVTNACVEVVSSNPANPGAFTGTGQGGSYLATGLAAGNYQVEFNNPQCVLDGGLAPQWYDDQPTQATAAMVPVTVGQTTPSINAELGTDGAITGTVSGPSATPVDGVCVTALPVPLDGSRPIVAVSGSGGYTLTNLIPGQYEVKFSSGCGATGYATQWWQDASSQAQATVITVGTGQVVSGKNATLTG